MLNIDGARIESQPGASNAEPLRLDLTDERKYVELSIQDIFPAGVAEFHLEVMTIDELHELTCRFVIDSRERIKNVLEGDLVGDELLVSKEAHSLKGSCFALGFAALAESARCIEHGETHLGEGTVRETANKFAAELNRLDFFLQNYAIKSK